MFKNLCKITFTLMILFQSICGSSQINSQSQQQNKEGDDSEAPRVPDEAIYQLDGETYHYKKRDFWPMIMGLPGDLEEFYRRSMLEESRPWLWAVVASTALGIYYDQDILDEAVRLAQRWGLPQKDKTKTMINIAGLPIGFPTDVSSGLYFIGDGMIHGGIMVGFLGGGYYARSLRAYQTGIQMIQGLALTAFATQVLKHITGRESPFTTETPGGVWRFFPDQIAYHKNVPKYDAYPSGHMATTMVTTTILAGNYPEYSTAIWSVGSVAMLGLGFGMLNNGVHWFGDYPLSLAMGYVFGRIAVDEGREVKSSSETGVLPKILPLISSDGSFKLHLHWNI